MSSIVSFVCCYFFFVDYVRGIHGVTILLCHATYKAGTFRLPCPWVNGMVAGGNRLILNNSRQKTKCKEVQSLSKAKRMPKKKYHWNHYFLHSLKKKRADLHHDRIDWRASVLFDNATETTTATKLKGWRTLHWFYTSCLVKLFWQILLCGLLYFFLWLRSEFPKVVTK